MGRCPEGAAPLLLLMGPAGSSPSELASGVTTLQGTVLRPPGGLKGLVNLRDFTFHEIGHLVC